MRITEALDLYLMQLMADGRSWHTRDQYARHIGLLASYFPEHRVEELLHVDLARFLCSAVATQRPDGKEKKASSLNALRSSVRTFFGYLSGARIVPTNTAVLVRRARTPAPLPKALSDAERERLVAALAGAKTYAERRDRALFVTLLTAGVRIGSALAANVADVDFEDGVLRLRSMKGGGEDTVFVPSETVELLREFVGERRSGPLFPAQDGVRLGVRQAHRRLRMWATRAAIAREVSPHTLRHTFGMSVYGASGDLLVTARALCHRSTRSTEVYARAELAQVRDVVQAADR